MDSEVARSVSAFNAYMAEAFDNYADVVAALNERGVPVSLIQTGGGCLALEAQIDEHRHVLLTDDEGPLPFEAGDVTGWLLGYYGPENDFDGSSHPEEIPERDYAVVAGNDFDEIAALYREFVSRPRKGPAPLASGDLSDLDVPDYDAVVAETGDDAAYADAFQAAYSTKTLNLLGAVDADTLGRAHNLLIGYGFENLEDFGPKEATAAHAALLMYDAIAEDIDGGLLPADLPSFSDAHDHCDANDYFVLALEALRWEYSPASDYQTATLNLAGDLVDWLLAERLAGR